MTTPHHLATLPFTSHQQQQQQHQHQQQRGMPYMQYMQQHGHQYVMQTHHQQQVPRLLTPPEDPQQQQQHFQYLKTAHALPFGPATAPRMMEHVHTASPAIEAYETFHGYLATVDDAWIILEACRQGLLRKVTDRPPSVRSTRTKKQSSTTTIRSGTIIVFDESRAQIKRWRDGLKWTASRISGAFLTYNERLSSDESNASPDSSDSCESSRLIKKTLAATLNGVKYHMVSYYTRGDLAAKRLETPSYWAAVNRLCLDKSRWSQAIIAGGWNSKTKRAPRAKAKALMQKPPVPSTTSPAALLTSVPISATIPTQSRMATPMITSPHLATPLMATPQMATPTPVSDAFPSPPPSATYSGATCPADDWFFERSTSMGSVHLPPSADATLPVRNSEEEYLMRIFGMEDEIGIGQNWFMPSAQEGGLDAQPSLF